MAAQGERIAGGYILITGIEGIRYAIRPQSVAIIHDADEVRLWASTLARLTNPPAR